MTPTQEPKKFYITTLGCPKNTADSQSMHHSLLDQGLSPTDKPEKSDFHLINTCTFIKSATEETIQTILDAGSIKRGKAQKLVVVGCFAERYPREIHDEIPEVDLVFGTGKYSQAGQILKEYFPLDFSALPSQNKDVLDRLKLSTNIENYSKPYSYVKISDGCNRGCAFCIIPSLRGKFKETPESEIINSVQLALNSGAKEICLVSQDTIFYQRDPNALADLLYKISAMPGLEILRPLYLYPDKKTFDLLDHFSKIPKIAPYLESPLQHVSSTVLGAMNRSGSYEFFKELFAKAKNSFPDLEIRTSFILGFPGETTEDVDQILGFVEEVKPEKVNCFAYSPEEGTKGASLKGKPKDKEIARRVNLVQDLHLQNLKDIHQSRIGKLYPAIIDETNEEGSVARRFQDAPEMDEVVYLPGVFLKPGQIGNICVESFMEFDMIGSWETP